MVGPAVEDVYRRVLEPAAPRVADPAGACFDFYRALVAYAASESGRARADLAAGNLPESRKRYEALLAELNLPGVEQFRRVATFRVAALTALGDIAFGEGCYDDSFKLYEEAVETAKKAGRLRSEGKTYRVKDGDVLEILFSR